MTAVVALAVGTVLIGRESARREEQRRLAVRNFALARDAVDRMLSRVGEVELADVPQMEAGAPRAAGRRPAILQGVRPQRGDDPSLRLELGRALTRLARVQELLGDSLAAEASYRRAIAMLGDLAAASAAARADLARGRDGLGMLLKKANRFREAEAELRAALRLREGLARESPAIADARQAVAESRYHLGALLARLRDRGPEDERSYRAALDIQRSTVGARGARPELRGNLARYLNNFGLLLADDGRDAEAEAAFREAAAIAEELSRADPGVAGHRWQWARALNNLGVRLPAAERADEAEAALTPARGLLEALRADFPAVPDYRRDLASVHSNLGRLWAAGGRRDDAEGAYQAALKLQEAIVAAPTPCPTTASGSRRPSSTSACSDRKTTPRPPRSPAARPSTPSRGSSRPIPTCPSTAPPTAPPWRSWPGCKCVAATCPGPDSRWNARSTTTRPPWRPPTIATAWSGSAPITGPWPWSWWPWATTPGRPSPPSASPSSCPTPATDTSTRPPSWPAAPGWPRATPHYPRSGGPSSRSPTPTGRSSGSVGPPPATC